MTGPQTMAAKSASSGALTAAAVGFDWITMGVGFVAALVALLHITPPPNEPRTPKRLFLLVAGSAFLAGVFVPVAVAGGTNYLPWLATVEHNALCWAMAAIIGAAPHVAPLAWRLWKEGKA